MTTAVANFSDDMLALRLSLIETVDTAQSVAKADPRAANLAKDLLEVLRSVEIDGLTGLWTKQGRGSHGRGSGAGLPDGSASVEDSLKTYKGGLKCLYLYYSRQDLSAANREFKAGKGQRQFDGMSEDSVKEMFKTFGVIPKLINEEELKTLFERARSSPRQGATNPTHLDFKQFQQLMTSVSEAFTRAPYNVKAQHGELYLCKFLGIPDGTYQGKLAKSA